MGRPVVETISTRCITKLPLWRHNKSKDDLILVKENNNNDHFRYRCNSTDSCPATIKVGNATTKRHKKSVSFTDVYIREYSSVIGDHPCCTKGCPLSLGWDYEACRPLSLEDFEAKRKTHGNGDFRTTSEERRQILAAGNVSECEIRRAERRLHRARSCDVKHCELVGERFFGGAKLSK